RVLKMVNKNCDAAVPEPGALASADEVLLNSARALPLRVRAELDQQAFHRALDAIWQVVGDANRYVDDQAPWTLRKTDTARMRPVLFVLCDVIRHLAILTQPFMPESAGRMLDQLAVPPDRRNFDALIAGGASQPGTKLPEPEGVFPRYVEEGEGVAARA